MISLGNIPIQTDLLTRTYEDFRRQGLELIPQLTPEWTDFYPSDPGIVLLEVLAGYSDILSYYIDRAVNESHWKTALLPQSVYDMIDLINYTPLSVSSATVTVNCTVTTGGTIPGTDSLTAPFQITNQATRDQTSFKFELLESYTPTSSGVVALTFIEGQTVFQEVSGVSPGTPDLFFVLSRGPVTSSVDGEPAVRVECPSGTFWTRVESFVDSTATDKHFTTRVLYDGSVKISFGDGLNGAIPTIGLTVLSSYRIGGGSNANNISSGKLNKITVPSNYVSAVTNTATPNGGDDAETLLEIKQNAPKFFATQDRAVTHGDFESLARTVSGVHKVKAAYYEGRPLYEGVWVAVTGDNPVPTGTWDINKQSGTGLLGAVGRVLVGKATAAIRVVMQPITAVEVTVGIDIYALDNYYRPNVEANALSVVEDYIRSSTTVTIPSRLSLSGLYALLESTEGIDYVNLTLFRREPYIEEDQIGIANTALSSVTVGGTLLTEVWTIEMTSTTNFIVYGSITGQQVTTGSLGTLYVTDEGQLSFTLTAGSILNSVGDRYKIVSSGTIDNVDISGHEIAIPGEISLNIIGGV